MNDDAVRLRCLIQRGMFLEICFKKKKKRKTFILQGNPESKRLIIFGIQVLLLPCPPSPTKYFTQASSSSKYCYFSSLFCASHLSATQCFQILTFYQVVFIATFKHMELAILVGRNKQVFLLTYFCEPLQNQQKFQLFSSSLISKWLYKDWNSSYTLGLTITS